MSKPIRLSNHARSQIVFRGATEAEVIQAVKTAEWKRAELGKLECRLDLPYGKIWNEKSYKTKQVRPIFKEEDGNLQIFV